MPAKRKREKDLGISFVVGALRKIARDPKASPLTKLRAIDRLIVIDRIAEVPLGEAGWYPPRIAAATIAARELADEVKDETESDLDRQAREMLEKDRGGNDTTTAATRGESSVPADSENADIGVR